MSKIDRDYWKIQYDCPEEVVMLLEKRPRLLPGEDPDEFFRLFEMMVSELAPDTPVEWLAAMDLAYIWTDITHYLDYKNAIICHNQKRAIEFALADTDPLGAAGMSPGLRNKARMDAQTVRDDVTNRNEPAIRLLANGYDQGGLNAAAFVLGYLPLSSIEKLLASARRQLAVTLRDVYVRREFKERAYDLIDRRAAERRAEEEASAKKLGSPDTEAA
jgi:hypothetical protein